MTATFTFPRNRDLRSPRRLALCTAILALLVAGCDVSHDEEADPEATDITVLDQNAEDGLPTDPTDPLAEQADEPFPGDTTPEDGVPEDGMPGDLAGQRSREDSMAQRNPEDMDPEDMTGQADRSRTTDDETSPGQSTGQQSTRPDAITGVAPADDPTTEESAVATISPVGDGSVQGEITFTTGASAVQIRGQLTGLEPGKHGFHIHENAQCGDQGDAAGGHLAPDGDPHGAPGDEQDQHHLGDFGNITANEDGTAEINIEDAEIRLARTGPDAIIGKALIVHVGEDDLTSQPSGQSGQPVGCGIIEEAQQQPVG